jgi:hypothetical protein
MLIPLAGFVAGLQHVVMGPDHLAAVAPLAVHDRRAAWRGGLSWALGHVGGVAIVALAALALRDAVPFDAAWVSGWSERFVGVVLIVIGIWGFRRALSRRLHTHVHEHQGQRHVHVHLHENRDAHEPTEPGLHHHGHAAFAVGTLHGMAGGSHFLVIVPALLLGTSDAVMYIATYGLGTVTAMVVFATLLGWAAARAHRAGVHWARGLMVASSSVAVIVGVIWLFLSFRSFA